MGVAALGSRATAFTNWSEEPEACVSLLVPRIVRLLFLNRSPNFIYSAISLRHADAI